jgi:flagellin-like protein
MRLKQLLRDDDGVSPVIGVILMVAITVILAAVIASFVLGLGDSADEVQPNTSFTFDYDNVTSTGDGEGNVTVTLSDGESLADNEVFIRGEQLNQTGQLSTLTGISVTDNEWSAGESIEIGVTDNDYVLNVVWESEDSDDSSRLQTDRGPEA